MDIETLSEKGALYYFIYTLLNKRDKDYSKYYFFKALINLHKQRLDTLLNSN